MFYQNKFCLTVLSCLYYKHLKCSNQRHYIVAEDKLLLALDREVKFSINNIA